jgi:hypothetical protein
MEAEEAHLETKALAPSKELMDDHEEFSKEYKFVHALYTKYESFDDLFRELPIYRFETSTRDAGGLSGL